MRAPFRRLAGRWLAAVSTVAAAAFLLLGPPGATAQVPAPVPGTKLYHVPSGSMEPTIRVGQNILVSVFPRTQSVRPAVGSVVVLHPPVGADPGGSSAHGACRIPDAMKRGMPCPRATGGRSDEEVYVERIVAGPGDRVAVQDGLVVRNGVALDEPYTKRSCGVRSAAPGLCHLPNAIRLPPNRYFLMGDNRGESNDSRSWGPVPRAWMVGVVTQIGVPAPKMFR
jgi:signal peptidase I